MPSSIAVSEGKMSISWRCGWKFLVALASSTSTGEFLGRYLSKNIGITDREGLSC
jgi:hypothetical protein